MRALFSTCLFLAAAGWGVTAAADTVPASPAARHPLLYLHPRPWQPPIAVGAGLRVAIDPVSGEFTDPGPLDSEKLAADRKSARAGIVFQTRADGSRFAILDGRIRSWSIASIGAGGALQLDCADSEAAALARLRALETTSSAKGEK